jgi:hypothetical protein
MNKRFQAFLLAATVLVFGTAFSKHDARTNTFKEPSLTKEQQASKTVKSNKQQTVKDIRSANIPECHQYFGGSHEPNTQSYSERTINFGNNTGFTAELEVYSYYIPNRFTVLRPDGSIAAQTAWLDNGSAVEFLPFAVTMTGNYTLRVETVENRGSNTDIWEAFMYCN